MDKGFPGYKMMPSTEAFGDRDFRYIPLPQA